MEWLELAGLRQAAPPFCFSTASRAAADFALAFFQ
jgi:hypothetical protein